MEIFCAFARFGASSAGVGVMYNILGRYIYSSQFFVVQYMQLRPLLLHLLIHYVRSHSELDATGDICARMQQIPMLEDEHPAYLWVYIERALHII